jgi:hypothetical protein
MVVHGKWKGIDASQCTAESQGFSASWGGCMVRKWVQEWLHSRKLPKSQQGCHKKNFTPLDDPTICAELRTYMHSNKWSMDPLKLANFTKDNTIAQAAQRYLRDIVEKEMPHSLKRYMETELFPQIQLKVTKGISLRTARQWLHWEGFHYCKHKKSLYYDGHEHPDVVQYCQTEFLPAMAKYRPQLVEFIVGDVENELVKEPPNCVERQIVLCAHDEMTVQANDGKSKSWVLEGEHALKKKGVGWGIHHSDVICSTVGWLKNASQSMEYGKNYDGYWTGELFVQQVPQIPCMFQESRLIFCYCKLVEKIILAFEEAHGPGYRALITVDNSQGHSAYAVDALLVS